MGDNCLLFGRELQL